MSNSRTVHLLDSAHFIVNNVYGIHIFSRLDGWIHYCLTAGIILVMFLGWLDTCTPGVAG